MEMDIRNTQMNTNWVMDKSTMPSGQGNNSEGSGKEKEIQLPQDMTSVKNKMEESGREMRFSVHEKTKQIMVKVVDKETKEVIKEIPSEKILDMVAYMCEQAGLFIDERR